MESGLHFWCDTLVMSVVAIIERLGLKRGNQVLTDKRIKSTGLIVQNQFLKNKHIST